jgi:drug/metabolite transporter (DMT)-like permease
MRATQISRMHTAVLLIVLAVIWGSSFILIKRALTGFTPVQLGSLRLSIAGVIFLPYLLFNLRKIEVRYLRYMILFGLFEIGLPPYLYALAQTQVASSTAGILNGLTPLFTLVTGMLLFRTRSTAVRLFGVLLGLLGAVLLIFTRISLGGGRVVEFDFSNSYGLLVVVATLCYGLGGNILEARLRDVPGLLIAATAFVAMALPATTYLLASGGLDVDLGQPVQREALLAVTVLAVFGSVVGIYLYTLLVRLSDALIASFITYLIPFVALFWGYLDGEPFGLMQPVCLVFILIGIYMVNRGAIHRESITDTGG